MGADGRLGVLLQDAGELCGGGVRVRLGTAVSWLPEGIWMGWLPRATFCMSGMVLAVTPPRSLCDTVR